MFPFTSKSVVAWIGSKICIQMSHENYEIHHKALAILKQYFSNDVSDHFLLSDMILYFLLTDIAIDCLFFTGVNFQRL
jgi:hypothetical protein